MSIVGTCLGTDAAPEHHHRADGRRGTTRAERCSHRARPRRVRSRDSCSRTGSRPRGSGHGTNIRRRFDHPSLRRLAIDVLQETDIQGAARILRISWDEAWHILEGPNAPAQAPARDDLGLDEKAIAKGHRYSRSSATWTGRPSNTSRRIANRPASRATSGACRRTSWPASRRSPWTCGSPMSRPSARTCPARRPRWSSTATTS